MSEPREKFLRSTLDRIEEREAKLLAWGIVDGSFSQSEIFGIIDPLIDQALSVGIEEFLKADAVLSALLIRQLITAMDLSAIGLGWRKLFACFRNSGNYFPNMLGFPGGSERQVW
jgi:hypothetical protein